MVQAANTRIRCSWSFVIFHRKANMGSSNGTNKSHWTWNHGERNSDHCFHSLQWLGDTLSDFLESGHAEDLRILDDNLA